MSHYDDILKLTKDDKLELAESFKETLHKELVLGQTRHVCRYGTLSDGHEKLTDSQRYYQAIKEMWYLRSNIMNTKATAMLAQADLMEAEEQLANPDLPKAYRLRNQAWALRAQEQLLVALTTVEDQMRMVDEYNKVRLELKDKVEAQYPEGIEQSEQDNWEAVYQYRKLRGKVNDMWNIPLPAQRKAELGMSWFNRDSVAWLAVADPELYRKLELLLLPKEGPWQNNTVSPSQKTLETRPDSRQLS